MLKSITYKTILKALRLFWNITGKRKITVFNREHFFTANTVFPSYWKLRLPRKELTADIVRYSDFVQFHAVVNYISGLKSEPVVIEAGAHHGAYAIVIGKMIQELNGKVIAIEPNPYSYNILIKNIQLNNLGNTVFPENIALLDRPCKVNISLEGVQSQVVPVRSSADCIVDAITLNEIVDKYKIANVDLLIIDVEGGELPVLKGFPWQSVSVGKLFCELHPYAWKDFGYSEKDVSDFLNMYDYRCVDMYLKEHSEFKSAAYIGPTLLYKYSSVQKQ